MAVHSPPTMCWAGRHLPCNLMQRSLGILACLSIPQRHFVLMQDRVQCKISDSMEVVAVAGALGGRCPLINTAHAARSLAEGKVRGCEQSVVVSACHNPTRFRLRERFMYRSPIDKNGRAPHLHTAFYCARSYCRLFWLVGFGDGLAQGPCATIRGVPHSA
jgi:hypothetical protein